MEAIAITITVTSVCWLIIMLAAMDGAYNSGAKDERIEWLKKQSKRSGKS